jgi:hypothetical protein
MPSCPSAAALSSPEDLGYGNFEEARQDARRLREAPAHATWTLDCVVGRPQFADSCVGAVSALRLLILEVGRALGEEGRALPEEVEELREELGELEWPSGWRCCSSPLGGPPRRG